MKTLLCDTCGEEIVEPRAERNYFHFEDWDICEPCKESIELDMRPTLRGEPEYHQDSYRDLLIRMISERNAQLKEGTKVRR